MIKEGFICIFLSFSAILNYSIADTESLDQVYFKLKKKMLPFMESEKGEQERERLEISTSDFISGMPDSIIRHILSFLCARDVTCTSVLSKTWNRIWSAYPYVVFHFAYSNSVIDQEQITDDLHIGNKNQEFLVLTEKSIRRRLQQEFPVQRFQLYIEFPHLELLTPNMDQWIDIAVERTVPELALCVDSSSGSLRSYYSISQTVLLASSIKVLSLSGCRFDGSLDIKLPHLQKLSLSDSCFADKFLFHKILSGCPVIEYVKVSFCKWMDTLLSVSSLPHLKYFEFLYCDDVYSIKINASNLHTFSFASSRGNWPRSIDLAACTALKELKLSGAGFTANFFPQPLISQLPALEVLELRRCTGRDGFRISSQRLKRLAFRDCRHLSGAEIDTPNLELFEYCNCDEPFVPIKASNQLQIHLRFSLGGKTVDWVVKLKHFLSKLSYGENLKFIIYRHPKVSSLCSLKDMIIHEKLSEVRFSSLCHFMYPKYICISSKSYTDLLDELFPSAFPETIFVLHSSSKIIELLSKKMIHFGNDPTLLHKLVGFEVDTYEDAEHVIDPATEVFIKAHSTAFFKTSAITLRWKFNVSKRSLTL